MIKSKIGYGAVIALTLVVALTHDGEFPRFLLGFELLLAGALWLCVKILSRAVDVKFYLDRLSGGKQDEICVHAEISNRSFLPLSGIGIKISCEDIFSGSVRQVSGTAMVNAHGKAQLTFRMKAKHCGVIRIMPESIRVSDFLGLFQKVCPVSSGRLEYAVIPEWKSQEDAAGVTGSRTAGGGGTEVGRSGDDYAVSADVRAFREGDELHSIHWKLSAKLDDLMVREIQNAADSAVLVFLDLRVSEPEHVNRDDLDRFYEKAASASHQMMSVGGRHYIVWAELTDKRGKTSGNGLVRYGVHDEASFQEMLLALVRAPLYKEQIDLDLLYKEQYADEVFRKAGWFAVEEETDRDRGKETIYRN